MKLKVLLSWSVLCVLALVPVFLLLMYGPRDYSSMTHTFGQVFGLMGLTLFALTFVLSTRAKWIEDAFDGLDNVYPVHSVLGAASFIFLLLHPIFLVLRFIPQDIELATTYLLPGGLLSVDLGIYALLFMTLLLVLTLYARMRYHDWKLTHEFMGAAFLLAILHVWLVRGDVSRDYIFSGYYTFVAIVAAIGIGAFAYSILRTYIVGRKYVVDEVKQVNGCTQIILEPVSSHISYRSGQFIFVSFQNDKTGTESHPFSIASATGSRKIRIIAKDLGDFTSQMRYIRKGDHAIVEGPYGRFHVGRASKEIWIAGGIGITPFLGLAQDLKQTRSSIELFYTARTKDELVQAQELKDIASSSKNFRYFPWLSSESGYLSVDEIIKITPIKDKTFYLCGPESLKQSVRTDLMRKGIPSFRIHDERFAFK